MGIWKRMNADMHLCKYVCVCLCVHVNAGLKEAIGFPGAGLKGSYELPDVDAGNQTRVLCKSNKCSSPGPSLRPLLVSFVVCFVF